MRAAVSAAVAAGRAQQRVQAQCDLLPAEFLHVAGIKRQAVIQAAGDSASYSLFVGPDDLPRRISVDLGGAPTTMDYSKWGEPVNIVAPTADELTEMPGL